MHPANPAIEPRHYKHLELLIHIFVVVLLVSNLVAAKITKVGPLTFSGAQMLFPITYIFGDIFTEVYGVCGLTPRHLDRLSRFRAAGAARRVRHIATAGARVHQSGGVRHGVRCDSPRDRLQPGRLLGG